MTNEQNIEYKIKVERPSEFSILVSSLIGSTSGVVFGAYLGNNLPADKGITWEYLACLGMATLTAGTIGFFVGGFTDVWEIANSSCSNCYCKKEKSGDKLK